MPVFVEFHLLQNVAPSLLNRDDTGGHKDALFGGVRRARISSQCLKRAMRDYWKNGEYFDDGERALRTKRIVDELERRLTARGRDGEAARAKSQTALAGGIPRTTSRPVARSRTHSALQHWNANSTITRQSTTYPRPKPAAPT